MHPIIDTHTHMYDASIDADRPQVLDRAAAEAVYENTLRRYGGRVESTLFSNQEDSS